MAAFGDRTITEAAMVRWCPHGEIPLQEARASTKGHSQGGDHTTDSISSQSEV